MESWGNLQRNLQRFLQYPERFAQEALGHNSKAILRVLVGQIEDLTVKDVETRLANWLVKRCPNPQSEAPVKIELTMTKRVLAAELGTVGETFSRTLGKFREQKLLTVKGKTVTVLSPVKLSALLRRNLGE